MKTGSSKKLSTIGVRARSGHSMPKGAIIIGTYLVGMTGIAAGALAMRNLEFDGSNAATGISASTQITARLVGPALPETASLGSLAGTGTKASTPSPEAPRLAALTPSETRLADDLASPLSRIFIGQPAVVPPARPAQPGAQTERAADEQAEQNDRLQASLRPQLRPDDLKIDRAAISAAVQLASLETPEADTPRRPRDKRAALPEIPQITAKQGTCPNRLARDVPRRQGSAAGAQTVLASVEGIDGVKRDRHVAREILRGNMPSFLRNLVPVTVSGRTSDGTKARITICVTPDYLALGNDRDYVRVPLGLSAASQIADQFGMILPTPRMVDTIYRASALRLSPKPMSPGPQMTSTDYFVRHNATVEAQRRSAGAAPGTLIAGHKKDVVLTPRLASKRGRVAIYGWHRRNGKPIQPLSTIHGAGYADYSHGVRLVSRTAFLDGRSVDLRGLMADPRYAGLLSDEGPVGIAVLASN